VTVRRKRVSHISGGSVRTKRYRARNPKTPRRGPSWWNKFSTTWLFGRNRTYRRKR